MTGCGPLQATPGKAFQPATWGHPQRDTSALAYSCILSQACNQLIWDAISFFFLNPNKPKPIIFPQQEQQDGGFPAPSLALGVAPAPSVMVGGER